MKNILTHTAAIILSALSFNAMAIELPQKYVLSTTQAESIAKEALKECAKSQANVSISLVNDQGTLLYFYRGKETGSNTVRTSFRKAYTAASVKMPTSVLAKIAEAPGYSQLGKMEDDILLLPGGFPLSYKGSVIGGIGLSGSPDPDLEEACGKVASQKILGL